MLTHDHFEGHWSVEALNRTNCVGRFPRKGRGVDMARMPET
ncbi:MAG: hypothetical protein ACYTGQ_06810 [Planctomycetota bacterium]